jgi:hypothetical protein
MRRAEKTIAQHKPRIGPSRRAINEATVAERAQRTRSSREFFPDRIPPLAKPLP